MKSPHGVALRGGAVFTRRVMKPIDLAGKKFGRLIVVAMRPERLRYGERSVHVIWECVCVCDNKIVLKTTSALLHRQTKSCGCIRVEMLVKRNTKHGMSNTRAFWCWWNMKQRCRNPRNPRYCDYGERGIDYCEHWDEFAPWFADNGDPPPSLSFHRFNNAGRYEPGNVGWANSTQQALNRRPRKQKIQRANIADIQAFAASLARARGAAKNKTDYAEAA
jgi:hypothetical protein